ncbi:MAG: tetratricopeptide repeat protein [Saprospiraceae bacterium]|nr:tetratricopeptide repeat protein [Saprospiraceae bacterium]
MTKIKFCFTLFFLLFVFHTNAQQSHVDSLKQQLATAKADSVKIGLAIHINNAYSNTNLDSMVFYSKQAIHLLHHALDVEKVDSNKLQILWGISDMNQYVSNDSMVFYAQQALLICIKNRNSFPAGTEAKALSFLASSLWWAGNYPDAKEAYFKALQIAEPLADTMLIGHIYNGIAMVNRNAGNYREAINYYTKAENLTKNIPDNDVLNALLVDKGKCYEQLGILDSAYTYVQECLAMYFRRFKGKNVFGGGVHSTMGIIYSKMGKEQLAVEFFRQSFQLNSEVSNIRLLARGYCEFAEHFDRFNQRDSAIYYATKGLLIDRQFNLLVQQLQASTLLTKLYKQENKIDSAFKYQQLMIETRDSVFSREKINRLQTLEFNEQLRQLELASEKIKSEEERKQNIQYALIAIGLVTLIILFLFLSRSFITNTKLISFFGVIALLLVFEFLNLLLHPFLERITHHSPILMLLALVCIAALLVPLHHKLEKWTTVKLVEKNKATRLANAKKTIEKLEDKTIQTQNENTNV